MMNDKPRCQTCRHFIGHAMPDDLPGEPDGYCAQPEHAKNDYGGHWTWSQSSCADWKPYGEESPQQAPEATREAEGV